MKKIYLLSLLCCIGFAGFSQTTVTIWANTATAGTFITGNASSTGVRTDNTIVATGTAPAKRGYAVFDLSTIPAGSQITSVTAGFYVSGVAGGTITTTTYGYPGDLSTVTVPATLYADMIAGTALTAVAYTAATGNKTIVSTAAAVTFLQANIGSKISYCYTNTGTYSFTISGETGSTATITTLDHAPYLQITYCAPPTSASVTAAAAPNPLCVGDMLNLTGTGTGTGTISWLWSGPGSYTSTNESPSFATGAASSGVYTLTVTNTCTTGAGTATAVTPFVTVNPVPTAITGTPDVCTGGTNTLTGVPTGGSWSSSLSSYATIDPVTGMLTGVGAGVTNITYTFGGCYITELVTDNDPGAPISGPGVVCVGSTINLADMVSGGVWSSDLPGTGSVDAVSGIVTGIAAGTANISYTTGGCGPVTFPVTVNDVPQPISSTSFGQVCVGLTTPLTDPTPGGVWGSSMLSIASVDASGVVSGIAPGTLNITYTDPTTSCQAILPMTVNALPGAISGPSNVCAGGAITLADLTPPTGVWSGGSPHATIVGATGLVNGVSAGAAVLTYTDLSTTCYATYSITVNPLPAAISGAATICQGSNYSFTDATSGGVWTSSNTSFATVGLVSGVVSGVAVGPVSIIYTLPTGCVMSQVETVNPAPASVIAASGATTFCSGGSVVLSAPVGAGLTYQWDEGGVAITGATDIAYTASVTGSFTLIVTNAIGCPTTSTPELVNSSISAALNNAGVLAFCVGNDVALTVNTGSAVGLITYQWQLNGLAIPGAVSSTYNATATGNYSCYVTVSGGSGTCNVTSDTDAVTVHPLPSPAIDFTGTVLTTASAYSGYQWYVNNVGIVGATSRTLLPTDNGSYKVYVTDGNGCEGFSGAFLLTNVGVNQVVNNADITISPNPATSVLHIASPVNTRAVITGIEGKVLIDQANATDINVAGLADGLYLISLYDNSGLRLTTTKFIKQ